jgi:hypothetical protein
VCTAGRVNGTEIRAERIHARRAVLRNPPHPVVGEWTYRPGGVRLMGR